MKNKKVAVVVMENTLISSVLGIDEIFELSNNFCKRDDEPIIECEFVSIKKDMKFRQGKFILETKFLSDDIYDAVILPPVYSDENFSFENEDLNSWLIEQFHNGATLTSACVGSFFLATTKLLDGKSATTHWMYEDLFKSKFPLVALKSDKILVDEGRIITAGGVSAYMDLALYLIEKFCSQKTANSCSNMLLIDRGRDSQRCYKDLSAVMLFDDEVIKRSVKWMKENIKEQFTSANLAERSGVSERTYNRRFKKALGVTPNHYIQALRVEEAKHLLISSSKSFEEITFEVGFFNESSFRKLFKRETSLNPGEYRKKFQQNIPV